MTGWFPKRAFIRRIALLAGCLAVIPLRGSAAGENGPDTLIVDYARVINDTQRRQIGINTCFLTDDDRNALRHPKRRYNAALKKLGVRYLRYPGGWKSDVVFWSAPPYAKPLPTLIYRGPGVWPSSDTALVGPDGSWKIDPYDFDEFIETCREVGAEPVVVVCYNSMHWPEREGGRKPDKKQILENAVSWVRYANIIKKYNVRYWEIGNETYLGDTGQNDRGKWIIPPGVYGADLADIARAMKSVDPSVQIGANGDSREYWSGIFDKAADVIDFLSVHTYPLYGLSGYREYLDRNPDLFGPMTTAKAAVAAHPGFAGREIKMMMTEFAAGSFDRWDRSGSDIARAVITFDLQGQLLQSPDCYFSQFWNTINVYEGDNSVFNALMRDNSLTAVGRALSIWGNNLEDEMILTQGTCLVRCFATRTEGKTLTVFAVNRDTLERRAAIVIRNMPVVFRGGEKWVFRGKSQHDPDPSLTRACRLTIFKDTFSVKLDPVSVTMFRFREREE